MVWEQWCDITNGRMDEGEGGGSQYPRFFFKKKHGDDYENDSPDTISYQEQFG